MDRVTQLQDHIDLLAFQFYTYIGVLQRDAVYMGLEEGMQPRSKGREGATAEGVEAQARDMAHNLLHNLRTVDLLVDSLPGINATKSQQLDTLKQLDDQNQQYAAQLKATLRRAEESLAVVQQALQEIYADHMESQKW